MTEGRRRAGAASDQGQKIDLLDTIGRLETARERAVSVVAPAVDYKNYEVRWRALEALDELAHEAAIPVLSRVLRRESGFGSAFPDHDPKDGGWAAPPGSWENRSKEA